MFERYLFAAIILLILDFAFIWLNKVTFQNQIIQVQRVILQPDYLGAILSYICIILLLFIFIIRPRRSVQEAFILGILVYGVFEFTNKAIFKKWQYMTVFIDILWGGILFGLVTKITEWFFSR